MFYPITNHGDAMVLQKRDFNLVYKVYRDTISFESPELDTNHISIARLLKSKLVVKRDGKIYEVISGYTYVESKLVSDKYDIYAIAGKLYKQKRMKNDFYGQVRKGYNLNKGLRKRLKELNVDSYKVTVIKGKEGYDKYGLIGINGVVEIELKK